MLFESRFLKLFFFIVLLVSFLSSCMVGPNFKTPPLPHVKEFAETPLPAKTLSTSGPGGEAQHFLKGRDIPGMWWKLFQSPEIDTLIRAGFANSPNLAAAKAALRQAIENVNVQIGNTLWPSVNASGFAQRQRYSRLQIGITGPRDASTFTLYNVSVNVSYTVDVFGGARRGVESIAAQAQNQEFQLVAAYLTLASNIVTTSITVASYQAQIEETIKLIKIQEAILAILQTQYHLGSISITNVLTQQTLLEQTKATLPPLQKSLSQARHSLSVLVGKYPECPLPLVKLEKLKLPTAIPVSIPSHLVRQRPDVRAAEELMHSACAQIGVATANLLPQFNINGSYGWLSNSLGTLFNSQNVVWNIMGQVSQPLFRGGALLAARRAAIAAYQQAAAQYRQTVLQAFQNVADVLRALEMDARTLKALLLAEKSAKQSLYLVREQYRLGATSYINLLNAQQQYQQIIIKRIQAQALRYSDTAALFQALGGGWWHKPWCATNCS